MLLDMIGDRDLTAPARRQFDAVAGRHRVGGGGEARSFAARSRDELTTIEDDHIPFLRAGVPSVDLIDLDNPTWHTPQDTIEFVSARSLQTVGDVVLAALPDIEKRLAAVAT